MDLGLKKRYLKSMGTANVYYKIKKSCASFSIDFIHKKNVCSVFFNIFWVSAAVPWLVSGYNSHWLSLSLSKPTNIWPSLLSYNCCTPVGYLKTCLRRNRNVRLIGLMKKHAHVHTYTHTKKKEQTALVSPNVNLVPGPRYLKLFLPFSTISFSFSLSCHCSVSFLLWL